jgi:4-hydroxy-tetrahydrodipicolinate synthase
MLPPKLTGIIPPVVTPLLDINTLDVNGLESVLSRLIENEVHGLFILGTTGEGPNLSHRIRKEIIKHTTAFVKERKPVFVGVTDTSPEELLEIAFCAADNGADALVFAPPYYSPLNQQELLTYAEWLIPQLPMPVLLYNMPSHCKVSFSLEAVKKLSALDKVLGIKDSSGDMSYLNNMMGSVERPDFCFFTGPEILLAETLFIGGNGGVSGGANLYPQLFVGLYEAFQKGDLIKVMEFQQVIKELDRAVYFEGFMKGVKTALAIKGICKEVAIPPLFSMTPNGRNKLESSLKYLEDKYPFLK